MRVVWTVPAMRALRKVDMRIRSDNPVAAARVVARIRARVAELREHPGIGRIGRIAHTRELVITGTPYVVAYAVADRQVNILTVKHGAQEWPARLDGFGVSYGL